MRPSLALLVAAFAACTGDNPELGGASPAPDAGSAEDAGAPPADAAVDAPKSFCATQTGTLWCEDFDSITDVSSLVPESSDPTIAPKLTQGTYRSPPRALRFNLIANAPAPQYTVIARSFPTKATLRMELDWRLAILDATEGQTLQSITLKSKNGQAAFGRSCGAADAGPPECSYYVATCVFDGGTTCATHPITARIAGLDDWSHVALEARFDPKGHVRFEQDGTTILDVDTATEKAPLTGTDPVSATVGIAVLQANAGPTDILVDNVVVVER